jgi:uncharacterized protein GlcG (DUF336 family)
MTTTHRWTGLAAAAALATAFAGSALAQAPKLTIPLTTLQTGTALTAAQSALARCQKDGLTVAVAVVDRGGAVLALLRDPLAGPHTVQTATGKAWTAVSFRTETTELATLTQAGRPASGVRALPGVIAVGGGMMIRAKGVLLGGIGVSGAPGGDQDDVCAKAGLAAIVDSIELE